MAFTIIKLVIVGVIVSLLIIIKSSHSSGYIYYEKPSSARLAAASHTPPACVYQSKKYAHGQQVTTQEPCLNCTCKKGVLLCFLRVCPTLIQPSPHENCVTTREPGQCCPTLKCESPTTSIINESPTTVYSPTTASTTIANNLSISSTKSSDNNSNLWKANKLIPQTNSSDLENVTLHYSAVERTTEKQPPFAANIDDDLEDRTKLMKAKDTNRITVTQKDKITTIFQTSPSTSYHESLLLVTSSPDVALNHEDSDNLININKGSCVINGTIYAEGSAVISTSFCEYCYCIRSKRMCIRPRCHLSIMGCLPRYISEYACCPTSYVCGEQALTTLITTTTTTTTNSILFGRKSMCLLNGLHYQIGDAIPSDEDCKQCYCSTGAVKKCKKIQCSPAMDGCVPIIPEGHCCPVEYKCNSTQKQQSFNSDKLKPAVIEDTQQTTQLPDISTNSVDNEVTSSIDELITRNSDLSYSETNGSNTENYVTINDSDISNFSEDTTAANILIPVNQSLNLSQRIDSFDAKAHSLRKDDEFIEKVNSENVTDYVNEINAENLEESSRNPDLLELSTIDTNTVTYDSVTYRTDNSVKDTNSYTEVNSIETKDDSEIGTPIEQISTTQISLSNLTQFSDIDVVSTAQSIQDGLLVTEISTPNINSSESVLKSDDTENSANETTFEKVEDFLQGIIRAIDKHLHPALPEAIDKHLHPPLLPPLHQHSSHAAEPRESVKENNSNEIQSNLRSDNDANKLPTSRGHVPLKSDMSSAFFITDSENNPPFKIHSDSESGGVEIITSKTPFHDIHNYGDSILINLTPSSLKVVPPSGHLNPSYNDRHTQTIAQNNRAPTYVKPSNSNFNLHNNMMSPNEWKIMNQNVHRRPQYEVPANSHKSSDSLYYNGFMKRHDVVDEEPDNSDKELEKRARIEENPSDAQRMRVIPFKMNDAVFNAGTLSLNRKNSSFIIRLPAPSKVSSTTKASQQTSCIYNSQEFANGAMIPKSDPCTLCRCFYGRELCQEQKCPSQPEKNCTPERVPGYCCPRYICRVTEEMIANSNLSLNISETIKETETSSVSTIRKGPQYPAALESPLINESMSANIKTEYSLPDIPQPHIPPENLNHFDDMLPKEENKRFYQSVPDYPAVPAHVHGLQSKYPPFPLDPTPKTYHKINTYNHNVNRGQNENRVHFPNININKNNSYRDPINLQPSISDSISPLIPPHPRPSLIRPSPYQSQQNSGANKYRIKPAQMHSLSNSNPTSMHGIQNRPPVRMPPFLLNNNVPNIRPHTNQAANNLRNKTPTGALITPIMSEIQQNRPVLLSDKNITSTSNLNDSHKDLQQPQQQQSFTDGYKLSSLKPNIELEKNRDENPHHTLTQTLSFNSSTNNLTKSFSSEVPDIGLSSIPITTEMPVKSKLFITTRMKQKTTVAPKIELMPTKQAFIPTISSTILSTTTTLSPKPLLVPNESNDKTWDPFRVSGCNIYGTMYNIDEEISQLSTACKKCICSNVGVKCDNVC